MRMMNTVRVALVVRKKTRRRKKRTARRPDRAVRLLKAMKTGMRKTRSIRGLQKVVRRRSRTSMTTHGWRVISRRRTARV